MLQHCEECAGVRFPPALVCGNCGSSKLTWRVSTGHGKVYSTTTVRDRAGDYNVAIVELEGGGARMMSRVEGVAPDDIHIGQNVCARIVSGEAPFVAFTLDGDIR